MQIENSNITFCAHFNNYAKVLKGDKISGKYAPHDVSFVSIDASNELDLSALKKVYENWNREVLAEAILRTAEAQYLGDISYRHNKIFALTTQEDNFEHFEPDKILGIADVKVLNSKGHAFLEHIIVKPFTNRDKDLDIKKIGTAMLDTLKSCFVQIYLVALDKKSVKSFYLRNGFIEEPINSNHFMWQK